MKKIKLTAYTDAASFNNGKKDPRKPEHSASAGVVLYDDVIIIGKSIFNSDSSISFGELYAIYMIINEVYDLAIESGKFISLILHSDSAYCVQSINSWMSGWKKRSKGGIWYTSSNEPVAYQEIFEEIDTLLNYSDIFKVKIKHISGHIDMYNKKHVKKALARYVRFNGTHTTPEQLKVLTKYNDLVDIFAKCTLRKGMGGEECERNRHFFKKYKS